MKKICLTLVIIALGACSGSTDDKADEKTNTKGGKGDSSQVVSVDDIEEACEVVAETKKTHCGGVDADEVENCLASFSRGGEECYALAEQAVKCISTELSKVNEASGCDRPGAIGKCHSLFSTLGECRRGEVKKTVTLKDVKSVCADYKASEKEACGASQSFCSDIALNLFPRCYGAQVAGFECLKTHSNELECTDKGFLTLIPEVCSQEFTTLKSCNMANAVDVSAACSLRMQAEAKSCGKDVDVTLCSTLAESIPSDCYNKSVDADRCVYQLSENLECGVEAEECVAYYDVLNACKNR